MQSASDLDKHRRVLGILYVAFSALHALGALVVFALLMLGVLSSSEEEGRVVALGLSGVLVAFLLLLSLPGLIGGIGLLKRRAWSKVPTLVVAVLSLFSFPIGTALGIYTLWFWFQPNTRRLFFPREPEPRGPELGGPDVRPPLVT
jgi:hypothetical protein